MKSTKKALFLAIVSTLLCVVMLAGTTFAWFTDTVESGKNKIVSGNLDVDFEYSKDMSEWKTVKGTTDLFSDVALWEPGSCSVVYLKVTNKGSLAVKYNVAVTVDSEIAGTNVNGDAFKLSDYIKFGQVEDVTAKYATREDAIGAVSDSAKAISEGYAFASTMKAGDPVKTFALVVYMPETLGNEVNYKTGTPAPTIELGAVLQAAQLNYETDSYDKDYDKAAVLPWIGLMATAEEFAENVDTANKEIEIWDAENLVYWSQNVKNYDGYTIKLMADIDLGGANWTPIVSFNDQPNGSTNFVLDGNGHKIANLTVSKATNNAGFIGSVAGTVEIKNLTFTNPSVSSNGSFIGTVIGYQYGHVTLDNVDVIGGSVKGLNYTMADTEKSIRVGGLVGFSALDDTGVSLTLKDCDVDGVTLQGYHTTCGFVGTLKDYTARDNWSIANCSVKNCTFVRGSQTDKHSSEITVDGTAYPSVEDNLANFNGKVVTENNTNTKYIAVSPASFKDAMKNISNGDTLYLTAGTYDEIRLEKYEAATPTPLDGVTIKAVPGDKVVVKALTLCSAKNTTVDGFTFYAEDGGKLLAYVAQTGNVKNYLENNTNVSSGAYQVLGGAENVTIKNCTFTSKGGTYDASKFRPIDLSMSGYNGNKDDTVKIDGCTFDCVAFNYINADYNGDSCDSVLTVNNCVFGTRTAPSTIHSVINATGSRYNFVVTNNKFNNWGRYIIGSSLNGDGQPAGFKFTYTFTGNEFYNDTAVGVTGALGNKVGMINAKIMSSNTMTDANFEATISGNTYLGAVSTVTDATALEIEH